MSTEVGYGFFPGGDPRDFHPDAECSTDAERALHSEHCAMWDRGEHVTVPTSGWVTPNMHVTRSSYGLGTYTFEYDGDDDGGRL